MRESKITLSTQESIQVLIESQEKLLNNNVDSYDARNPFWKLKNGEYDLDESLLAGIQNLQL